MALQEKIQNDIWEWLKKLGIPGVLVILVIVLHPENTPVIFGDLNNLFLPTLRPIIDNIHTLYKVSISLPVMILLIYWPIQKILKLEKENKFIKKNNEKLDEIISALEKQTENLNGDKLEYESSFKMLCEFYDDIHEYVDAPLEVKTKIKSIKRKITILSSNVPKNSETAAERKKVANLIRKYAYSVCKEARDEQQGLIKYPPEIEDKLIGFPGLHSDIVNTLHMLSNNIEGDVNELPHNAQYLRSNSLSYPLKQKFHFDKYKDNSEYLNRYNSLLFRALDILSKKTSPQLSDKEKIILEDYIYNMKL